MNGADLSVGGAFGGVLWFVSELAFKWIPATVETVAGTGNPNVVVAHAPTITPMTTPVTAPEAALYLSQSFSPGTYDTFYHNWIVFVAISLLVSIILMAFIIYCAIRILQVRRHERQKFALMSESVAAHNIPQTHLRWNHVLEEAHSENEQNWRLAILEADIMLKELLDTLGYRGETIADKMKQVDRADFNTIDLAWEAHKVRNSIAHEGSARALNAREVHRVIGLYQQVFREFKFIE